MHNSSLNLNNPRQPFLLLLTLNLSITACRFRIQLPLPFPTITLINNPLALSPINLSITIQWETPHNKICSEEEPLDQCLSNNSSNKTITMTFSASLWGTVEEVNSNNNRTRATLSVPSNDLCLTLSSYYLFEM